jgi:DNA-binding transcriptional MerR regulator
MISMELRIDELAARAGTTSRNIRAYQARGLLPPPRLRGRTGFYGEEHLRRLALIDDLQQRGFSLAAIQQTLDAWSHGGDLGQLLGLHRLVTAPWTDEQATVMSAEDLLARFPETVAEPELIAQASDLGLIALREDGDFDVPSPTLVDAGGELVRAGIPLHQTLDVVKAIRADIADIADRFVDLIARNLVEPLTRGTASPEEVDAVADAVARLRPLAMEVVRPFLAQELRRAADESLKSFGTRLAGWPDHWEPAGSPAAGEAGSAGADRHTRD